MDSSSLTIENMGTADLTFSITDQIVVSRGAKSREDATWLSYSPDEGTILPSGSDSITLYFDATALSPDTYTANLMITHNDTTEANPMMIPCTFTVLPDTSGCTPPDWQTPEGFSESMTVTCRVYIDGVPEEDAENLVGAFVGDEVRGVNDSIFYNIEGVYIALLTVASNTIGEEVSFKLFDASSCEIMEIDETLAFSNDGYGDFTNPIEFHVTNSITQTIPLIENWNWISFNVEAEDMGVNNVLASIGGNASTIKTNNTSAQYVAGMGWLPPIEIDKKKLYKIKMDIADTLELEGQAIETEATPISLIENWNWIAYLPQDQMDVNTALGSLSEGSATTIKTNNTSAQYVAGMGWLPPISMIPNKGYKIQMNQPDTLTYPSTMPARSISKMREQASRTEMPQWYVPEGFEESMSIACYVTINGEMESDTENMIGAFVDGEIRGVSNGGFYEVNGVYVAFVTVAGMIGEEVTFELYDASSEEILSINDALTFQNDGYGSPENPYEFQVLSTGIEFDDIAIPQKTALQGNFPNPFNPITTIRFDLAQSGNISLKIYDTMGRLVKNLIDEKRDAGYHSVIWDGTDERGKSVHSGLYLYRLEVGEINQVKRMLMLK
jgi:hypothetical protein